MREVIKNLSFAAFGVLITLIFILLVEGWWTK